MNILLVSILFVKEVANAIAGYDEITSVSCRKIGTLPPVKFKPLNRLSHLRLEIVPTDLLWLVRSISQHHKPNLVKQESVWPRWPYDMRPSVHAEKYGCPQCVPKSTSVTLAVDEKTLPVATIMGRTDRQTDRQSATQYAAPPREEGRIIIIHVIN